MVRNFSVKSLYVSGFKSHVTTTAGVMQEEYMSSRADITINAVMCQFLNENLLLLLASQ